MDHALRAACREALRRAGLPAQGELARLLLLLRAAPDTHLGFSAVAALAARAGLPAGAALGALLDTLVAHRLLARLPSAGPEPAFDTEPTPHSHILYEETGQVVDLDVSPETLLGILRQALAERPGGVDVLLRVRRDG